MSLQFGDFELDRERRQLLRSGQPVPLEPRAYELLSLPEEPRGPHPGLSSFTEEDGRSPSGGRPQSGRCG